ncbi:hypothetical protein VUR80DRAFT_7644 [Thermomyces stellatus]
MPNRYRSYHARPLSGHCPPSLPRLRIRSQIYCVRCLMVTRATKHPESQKPNRGRTEAPFPAGSAPTRPSKSTPCQPQGQAGDRVALWRPVPCLPGQFKWPPPAPFPHPVASANLPPLLLPANTPAETHTTGSQNSGHPLSSTCLLTTRTYNIR